MTSSVAAAIDGTRAAQRTDWVALARELAAHEPGTQIALSNKVCNRRDAHVNSIRSEPVG